MLGWYIKCFWKTVHKGTWLVDAKSLVKTRDLTQSKHSILLQIFEI